VAVLIPNNAVVTVAEDFLDSNRMVDVIWNDKRPVIFVEGPARTRGVDAGRRSWSSFLTIKRAAPESSTEHGLSECDNSRNSSTLKLRKQANFQIQLGEILRRPQHQMENPGEGDHDSALDSDPASEPL
jgi:hypothetical protein